jgi:hypothetical protein
MLGMPDANGNQPSQVQKAKPPKGGFGISW